MKTVDAKAIRFLYKDKAYPILDDVYLELEKSQISAITGPSGCGKSTLGYCLAGIIPRLIGGIFSGEVILNGKVGFVFQNSDEQIFLPTVEDELAFGPENLCLSRDEIGERIKTVLEWTGLTELRQKNPTKLSGGQKQLVALAGVMSLYPEILVLDETLSQLDLEAKERIKLVLLELKKKGTTIIMIEHEKKNFNIADQVFLLNQGKLKRV
ncbi:MAG: ABC transporter ATP-binding protein [Clostridia bacterium]